MRLSIQIGSGLMGMLYVLDEPSIGLHPKDNVKMISTLQRLRDIGNTVIVVEHDEDTIRAADHIVEMGPGPGVHGGEVVAQGSIGEIIGRRPSRSPASISAGGSRSRCRLCAGRRPASALRIVGGARRTILSSIDVEIPLGQFVCVTGASGSGKSSLINEIVQSAVCSVSR